MKPFQQLRGHRAPMFAGMFLLVLFAVLIVQALRTKLYYDEILSYYLMRQPTASAVVQGVQDGSDNSAPLYFLIAYELRHLLPNTDLVLRLPGVVGYSIACLCVFIFLYRRLPGAYAGAGMLLMCVACLQHSFEARPYGLLLGSAGCAMVLWQTAACGERRWWVLPGMTISLACCIAFHYFAIYMLIPYFAGEIWRWRRSGRRDIPALVAIAIPSLVLIPHIPIILATQRFVPYFYGKIVFPISESRYLLNARIGYFEGLGIVLFFLWLVRPWKTGALERERASRLAGHEWVFAAALALAPYVAIVVALLTTRIFIDRYCIWALFGFVILFMAGTSWVARGATAPGVTMLVAFLSVLGIRWSVDFLTPPHLSVAQTQNDELTKLPRADEPIVFAPADVYLELSYYGSLPIRHRFVYLIDPELSRRYSQSDTDSFLLSALSRRAPLNVQDAKTFLAANPRFILFDDPLDQIEGWLFWYLLDAGYEMTPLDSGFAPGVYQVRSHGNNNQFHPAGTALPGRSMLTASDRRGAAD
jgi:hypothetical protein